MRPLQRKSDISYEVYVRLDGRWSLEGVESYEKTAVEIARSLLTSRKYEAVKVVEEKPSRAKEKVVFEKESERAVKPMTVASIDEVPLCADWWEVYRFEARKAIGRLLRQYLDHEVLTPLELLHAPRHARYLARQDTLMMQLVHRVAAIQARMTGGVPRDRLDFLETMVHGVVDRAPQPADAQPYLEALRTGGMAALLDIAASRHKGWERDFFVRVGLAARLAEAGDWAVKLGAMVDLAAAAPDDEARSFADEAIAEILDGAEAIKEFLPDLAEVGAVLLRLVQLSRGRCEVSEEETGTLARLNAVIARHSMPATASVLVERLRRQLAGVTPLSRESGEKNGMIFRKLIGELAGLDGLAGGPAMCLAVTQRARIALVGKSGEMTTEEGIDAMAALLGVPGCCLGYLLDLGSTETGARHAAVIARLVEDIATASPTAERMFPDDADPSRIAAAVDSLRRRLPAANLPEHWRNELVQRMDAYLGLGPVRTTATAPPPPPAPPSPPVSDTVSEPPDADTPANTLQRRVLRAGELLFQQGEMGGEAYLIVSGRVNIHLHAGGKDVLLAAVGPGQIIGEMSIIDDQPRMASAHAAENTVLTVIPRNAFRTRLDRLEQTDKVMRRLLDVFVERLRAQVRSIK